MDTIEALQCPVKEMSKMNVGDEVGRDNDDNVRSPSRVKRTIKSENENDERSETPLSPVRRVERNKSGPLCRMMKGSRAPPKRSQSSKIGRPMFDPTLGDTDQQHNTRRGVNRTHSSRVKGTTRNPPTRSGSFQRRRVPDRTNSSSSLRRSSNKSMTTGTVETDDVSVTDSVYTSISIQTMDSIMIRKKQIPLHNAKDADGGGMSIEFDGSGNWIKKGDDEGEVYEDEFSVFSDSWSSDESCEVLSDYEEEEMDGAILEDEEDADEN
mmetsp:Transcript_28885/g.78230  ORF Transcript_28885/g.78230 Transcript_28885/m.78230 type:complete len:267 (-) Transcript_28885:4234-5034(-)